MSEIKPINVQMNVTIVMTIISTKYCFENGVVRHISPILGTIMSIIMILVIYNTIVGLMYAFASRFTTPFSKQYFVLIIVMTIVNIK
jgi:uncharacterized membrane protein YkvI